MKNLFDAITHNNIEEVKRLIEEGVDVNIQDEERWTALAWAARWGLTEIVRLLLEVPGIDVNVKDIYGYTALIWAARWGYTEIVRLLLEDPNIDINLQNEDGKTALMMAVYKRHTEIAELLNNFKNESLKILKKISIIDDFMITVTKKNNEIIIKICQ